MVTLQISEPCDAETIKEFDSYIPAERLREKLKRSPEEVLLIKDGDCTAGVLRWGYLWDYIPYLYFMHVRLELRGRGYAAEALRLWEEKMAAAGFDAALCSIPTDDAAQHFYRKMGYRETGALSIPFGAFAQADGDFIHQAARRGARGRLRRRAVQKPTIF